MTDELQHLLQEEAVRIEVPLPPITAIVTGGRRRRRVRRAQELIALAASVAMVAGVLVGVSRVLSDDTRGSLPGPASDPSASTTVVGPLGVSGSGVGTQSFGTASEEVLAAVAALFGAPDLTVDPQRYARIPGRRAWFEVADDPLSPSWRYPVISVTCWGVLCLIFGGDEADALQLRGWELAQHRRWSGFEKIRDLRMPDVRLAGSEIGLGDSWKRLHAAYPNTLVGGAEGASVAVQNTPWPVVSDGVAGWRLSGAWDSSRPSQAPAGAVVTRLSGGEGPQPGCC